MVTGFRPPNCAGNWGVRAAKLGFLTPEFGLSGSVLDPILIYTGWLGSKKSRKVGVNHPPDRVLPCGF